MLQDRNNYNQNRRKILLSRSNKPSKKLKILERGKKTFRSQRNLNNTSKVAKLWS